MERIFAARYWSVVFLFLDTLHFKETICTAASPSSGVCEVSRCSALEENVKQLQNQIIKLEEVVKLLAELTIKNNTSVNVQHQQQTRNDLLQGNSASLTDPRQLNSWSREVGFLAIRATKASLTKGKTLVFDRTITNIGNSYDKQTGIFTCKRVGTYIFSMSILCSKGSYIEVSIYRNNSPVFSALSDFRTATRNQGGGSVILKLGWLDTVQVKMTWPPGNSEGVVAGNGFTTFSGYLLKRGLF